MIIDFPLIRNCEFKFECEQSWDDLVDTGEDEIRYRNECDQTVHLVTSDNALNKALLKNMCVAIPLFVIYGAELRETQSKRELVGHVVIPD